MYSLSLFCLVPYRPYPFSNESFDSSYSLAPNSIFSLSLSLSLSLFRSHSEPPSPNPFTLPLRFTGNPHLALTKRSCNIVRTSRVKERGNFSIFIHGDRAVKSNTAMKKYIRKKREGRNTRPLCSPLLFHVTTRCSQTELPMAHQWRKNQPEKNALAPLPVGHRHHASPL